MGKNGNQIWFQPVKGVPDKKEKTEIITFKENNFWLIKIPPGNTPPQFAGIYILYDPIL